MNAVLQALTTLSPFAADLAHPDVAAGPHAPGSAVQALLELSRSREGAAATASGTGLSDTAVSGAGLTSAISPLSVKASVERHFARFAGSLQQDAHEFLVSLVRARMGWRGGMRRASYGKRKRGV